MLPFSYLELKTSCSSLQDTQPILSFLFALGLCPGPIPSVTLTKEGGLWGAMGLSARRIWGSTSLTYLLVWKVSGQWVWIRLLHLLCLFILPALLALQQATLTSWVPFQDSFSKPGIVVNALNPHRNRQISWVGDQPCLQSSRVARTTQKNPVSKNKTKQQQKRKEKENHFLTR